MDVIDYRLVLELQKNGRESSVRLARRLDISDAAVRRRVARLLADGAIQVTAVPSPEHFGLAIGAWVGVQVDPDRSGEVGERLKALPEVQFLGLTSGRYDYVLFTLVHSTAELQQFLTQAVAKVPGVRRTESLVVLETLKRSYGQIQEKDMAAASVKRARRRGSRRGRAKRAGKA